MASRFLTPLPTARGWMSDPLFQLQREIDRVFEDVFSNAAGGSGGARSSSSAMMAAPRIDLQDSEGELRLHADLPGVAPNDLDIRVEGDVLTIRGERKSESERNEQNFHVMERSHGRFQRSIQLPFAPDPQEVEATVREGVLELRIPKRAPQERSRRIVVRDARSGGWSQSQSQSRSVSGSSPGSDAGSDSDASLSSSNFGGTGSSSSGSTSPGSGMGSSGSGASSSGQGGGMVGAVGGGPAAGSGAADGGRTGAGSDGGGLAGTSGGPTAVPAEERSGGR